MNDDKRVADAIAQFPAEFGLRAFPGEIFRVSERSSYVSDYPAPDTVYLYTERKSGTNVDGATLWQSFAKGTPAELRAEVVALHA